MTRIAQGGDTVIAPEMLTMIVGIPQDTDLVSVARTLRAARRRRAAIFALPMDIFHEPAWDILLDLFIAEAEQRAPDFAVLCANAKIQGPTALRWITTLEHNGLVQALFDPATGMPSLELTPRGDQAMRDYLSEF